MSCRALAGMVSFVVFLLVAGCATGEPAKKATALDRYLQFEHGLAAQGLELNFEPYFSEYAYADIKQASADELMQVKGMVAYPQYFDETYNHFEKASDARRCLTVNGRTTRGDLASLSIEFLVQDSLRMNDANLLFVDSEDELPSEALCPEESRF